jgi:hypothetical protein
MEAHLHVPFNTKAMWNLTQELLAFFLFYRAFVLRLTVTDSRNLFRHHIPSFLIIYSYEYSTSISWTLIRSRSKTNNFYTRMCITVNLSIYNSIRVRLMFRWPCITAHQYSDWPCITAYQYSDWPCITAYQYSETNVMHILFNLLRINDIYMFRALLAHLQEALNKRHFLYCPRVMSVSCNRIGVKLQSWCSQLT